MTDLGELGVWASHLGLVPADEARRAAARIEDLGYDTIWVGEADGRPALLHAALLLEATEHVTVATGIANIWARDAQTAINGARALSEAHDGRFLLGLGPSHQPLVARRGHAYDKPYSATVEYIEALSEAGYTSPSPASEPGVVLAALGPRMLELARDGADGAHTFLVPVEHTKRARDILGDGPLLAPEQAAVMAETREQAREVADRHLRRYLDLPNYRRSLERLGWDDPDPGDDDLFEALIAWGDATTIVERIQAHLQAGADHVAVHPLTESADRLPMRELEAIAEARR